MSLSLSICCQNRFSFSFPVEYSCSSSSINNDSSRSGRLASHCPLFHPDVEPYVWYHQSRDKTSGFYSIKPVLSQLCREIMFHRRNPAICPLGQKIKDISLPLYGPRDICCRTTAKLTPATLHGSEGVGWSEIASLVFYVLGQYTEDTVKPCNSKSACLTHNWLTESHRDSGFCGHICSSILRSGMFDT